MARLGKHKQRERDKISKNAIENVGNGSKPFLNQNHELFCILYAGVGTRFFFNNAQNCYIEAYGYGKEMKELETKLVLENSQSRRKQWAQRKKSIELIARTSGSRLFTDVNISKRVAWLFDQYIDHNVMDRELAKTAMQDYDLRSKVDAIKEYNRVRDRVKDNKLSGEVVFTWAGDKMPVPKKK